MRKVWIVVALLPMAAYAFLLLVMMQQLQDDSLRSHLHDEVRSAAAAIERLVVQETTFLSGLANSATLDKGDLEEFRREAERARTSRPHVFNLILTDDQRQLVNLRIAPGQPLPPVRDPGTLEAVWRTGKPVAGDLVEGRVVLRVPVLRDGKVRNTITATLDPQMMSGVLRSEVTPKGWIAAIVDSRLTIIARSLRTKEFVGTEAVGEIVERIRAGRFAIERSSTKEGIPTYAAIAPVAGTGWHIVMGMPVALAEAPYQPIELLLIGGGGLALGAAMGLALLIVWGNVRGAERKAEALSIDLARATYENQEKSAFLATMSHELRTPLSGLIGFADLLAGSALADEQKQWVSHQRQAGQMLLAIINDILDYSKIEAGAVRIDAVAFDLHGLLRQCAGLIRPAAEAKGLTVDLDLAPSLPKWLQGDPTRLRQVIGNLLDNAVKFTARGGVRLSTSFIRARDGGIDLTVAVHDTGIGIPAGKRRQLFQRFSQLDPTITREYGGTGLGLAICKSLVELMGGTISAESVEGQGSTFWFTVRLRTADEPQAKAAAKGMAEGSAAARPARRGARVLVAEDNPVNQVLIRTVLERAGHTAVLVGNGAEAVEAIRREEFDLVLMDVHMPVLDGVGATRAIRALGGRHARVPILALSADVFAADTATGADAGMDGHVAKPFLPEELIAAMHDLLTRRAVPSADGDQPPLDTTMRDAVVVALGAEKASFLAAAFRNRAATVKEDLLRAQANHALLHEVTHQLIGPAGMLGYVGVLDACRALCEACRSGDQGKVDARLADLLAQLLAVQA